MRTLHRWLARWRARDVDGQWWERMRLFQRELYSIPIDVNGKVDIKDIQAVLEAALPDFQQGDIFFK